MSKRHIDLRRTVGMLLFLAVAVIVHPFAWAAAYWYWSTK